MNILNHTGGNFGEISLEKCMLRDSIQQIIIPLRGKYVFLNTTAVLMAFTYKMNAITPTPQMSAATPTFSPFAFSGAEI